MSDPRPIGVFDSGVGGLTVLREIIRRTPASRRSTSATTTGRRTASARTTRSWRSRPQSLDALVERDVKALVVACNTSTAVGLAAFRRRYDLPVLGVDPPGRGGGRAGDPQPAGRGDRHAGHDPLARLLQRDQGREPGGRGVRARDAGARAARRGGRRSAASVAERDGRRRAGATGRRARRRRRVDLPAAGRAPRSTRCCSAARTTRSSARSSPASSASGVAIVDSATATASALAELLSVNGLEATDATDGSAGPRRSSRPAIRRASPTRRPPVRAGVRLGRGGRARGAGPMTRRPRARPGATTAPGRPGSSSARRSAPRRRSSVASMERRAREGLVDWATVERLAIGRLERAPGAADRRTSSAPTRAGLRGGDGAHRAGAVGRARDAAPGRRRAVGRRRSGRLGPRQHRVVRVADRQARARPARPGRAARRRADRVRRWPSPTAGSRPASSACCSGFMGQRVLGQYDLALLSAEAAPGRLLFVEENIRQTARALGVPLDSFRTWIALHETTHAFEFEAHPWLRPYLASRLERQLSAVRARRPGHGSRGHPRARPGAARRGWRRALARAADGRGAAGRCSARRRP